MDKIWQCTVRNVKKEKWGRGDICFWLPTEWYFTNCGLITCGLSTRLPHSFLICM